MFFFESMNNFYFGMCRYVNVYHTLHQLSTTVNISFWARSTFHTSYTHIFYVSHLFSSYVHLLREITNNTIILIHHTITITAQPHKYSTPIQEPCITIHSQLFIRCGVSQLCVLWFHCIFDRLNGLKLITNKAMIRDDNWGKLKHYIFSAIRWTNWYRASPINNNPWEIRSISISFGPLTD